MYKKAGRIRIVTILIIAISCLLSGLISCIPKTPGKPGKGEKTVPPKTGYQLTPILTETLNPSQDQQTITCEGIMTVIIPPGGLDSQQKLVISKVGNPPPVSGNSDRIGVYEIKLDEPMDFPRGLELEFHYDPQGQSREESEKFFMEVEFYDDFNKTWLPVHTEYNETKKALITRVTHNGLWQVIKTPIVHHLRDSTYQPQRHNERRALVTDNFVIFYNLNEFYPREAERLTALSAKSRLLVDIKDLENRLAEARTGDPSKIPELEQRIKSLKAQETANPFTEQEKQEFRKLRSHGGLSKIPTSQSLPDEYYKKVDAPRYVVEVAFYAEDAWKKYKKAFDREPNKQNFKIGAAPGDVPGLVQTRDDITTWDFYWGYSVYGVKVADKFPIYIDTKIDHPRYYAKAGSIYIGIMSDLVYNIKHELFHGVQNRDYWMGTKQSLLGKIPDWLGFTENNLWWIESTAEYAAHKIASEESEPTGHRLSIPYFSEDFYSGGNPDDNHPYKNAWLWDYLVKNKIITFEDMYKKVAGASMAGGLRKQVENYMETATKKTLGRHYSDFTRQMLFDEKGPFKGDLPAEPLPLDTKDKTIRLSVPIGLTSHIRGLLPASSPGGRFFEVRLNPAHFKIVTGEHAHMTKPAPWWVDVYRLTGNRRESGNVQWAGGWNGPYMGDDKALDKACQVEIQPGDGFYIVVTGDLALMEQVFEFKIKELDKDKISGHWKLAKVENRGVSTNDGRGGKGDNVSGTSRNGFAEAKGEIYLGRNADTLRAMALSLQWNPPPATAKPGDKWDGGYKAEILQDIDRSNRAGKNPGKNMGNYEVKGSFGATGTEEIKIPDRHPILQVGLHMIQGVVDPRLQEGSVFTFPQRTPDYKYLCIYVNTAFTLTMGGMSDTYYYFYEWTPGNPPDGAGPGPGTTPGTSSAPTTKPETPAITVASPSPPSLPASGDDHQQRLSAAKARYDAAFKRYTVLSTTGGTGSIEEAQREAQEAYRELKELEARK